MLSRVKLKLHYHINSKYLRKSMNPRLREKECFVTSPHESLSNKHLCMQIYVNHVWATGDKKYWQSWYLPSEKISENLGFKQSTYTFSAKFISMSKSFCWLHKVKGKIIPKWKLRWSWWGKISKILIISIIQNKPNCTKICPFVLNLVALLVSLYKSLNLLQLNKKTVKRNAQHHKTVNSDENTTSISALSIYVTPKTRVCYLQPSDAINKRRQKHFNTFQHVSFQN